MQLYAHQENGLERTKDQNRVAFYWEMGTGKTFVGAEKMHQLGASVNLVICQKSKIDDWYEHFEEHYPKFIVCNLTNKQDFDRFTANVSNKDYYTNVGIINYDLVWRRPDLLKLQDFTLMLDESSLIQNERSKRSKFILKMKPKNVILLSGTPTGGKYEKLWSQMHLLGWNITKSMYWRQYVNVTYLDTIGRSVPIVTGYKNVDRLKRKMREHGCDFLTTESVFDMPEQNFIDIKISETKKYREFKRNRIVRIEQDPYITPHGSKYYNHDIELVGDTTLKRLLYERELCSIYCKEKFKALKDLIQSTDDRLIIFYNFKDELAQIQKLLVECDKIHISVVNGSVKSLGAYERHDDSVTLIQYQAGAMGLNLQLANKIIYFSPPLSSELYEQSKKRIHRLNQERPCFYYMLICENSVEEKIYKALEMRKDFTEALFEEGN